VKYSLSSNRGHHKADPNVAIGRDVVDYIKLTAAASCDGETGGILIGFHYGRHIKVTKASDAGPLARRSSCSFLRDTAYCQSVLQDEYSRTGADYVGEWHTHIIDLPGPSEGDLLTLARIILDPDYQLPSFVMIVVTVVAGPPDLHSFAITSHLRARNSSDKAGFGSVAVKVTRVIPEIYEAPQPLKSNGNV
jgi:integrative and conjugative element protein (TIGR02256 family)